jgi:hypothetical protein
LLPDFVIIGGQKCGTSSLYNYLGGYPEIAPAFRKELHFFDRNGGKGNILRYRAYFPTSLYKRRFEWTRSSDLITGEATPYYLFYPLAPERVRDVIPRAKLIALLRDPVDRAYSHYHHVVRLGMEKLSFEEAIEREAERLDGERERLLRGGNYDSFSHRKHSYLSRSIYVDQIRNWRDHFPEEQLLILRSEDLFADPASVLSQTLDFLGLPPLEREEYSKDNKGSYLKMDPATKSYLIEYFRPHNERLYEYLGRDFGWDR